jgi:hypothetical protein
LAFEDVRKVISLMPNAGSRKFFRFHIKKQFSFLRKFRNIETIYFNANKFES